MIERKSIAVSISPVPDFRDSSQWMCNLPQNSEIFEQVSDLPLAEVVVENPLVIKAAEVCGGCALKSFCKDQNELWARGEETVVYITTPGVYGGELLRTEGERALEIVTFGSETLAAVSQDTSENEVQLVSNLNEEAEAIIVEQVDGLVKEDVAETENLHAAARAIIDIANSHGIGKLLKRADFMDHPFFAGINPSSRASYFLRYIDDVIRLGVLAHNGGVKSVSRYTVVATMENEAPEAVENVADLSASQDRKTGKEAQFLERPAASGLIAKTAEYFKGVLDNRPSSPYAHFVSEDTPEMDGILVYILKTARRPLSVDEMVEMIQERVSMDGTDKHNFARDEILPSVKRIVGFFQKLESKDAYTRQRLILIAGKEGLPPKMGIR